MKVALIGVGQAGGKITERLARFDADMGFGAVQGALAINSADADLQSLDIVDTQLIGADRVNGHGVGGDNELGTEVMQSDIQQVLGSLDGRVTSTAEAIFVVAGLGGAPEAVARPYSSTTSSRSTTSRSTPSASCPDATKGRSTRPTRAAR